MKLHKAIFSRLRSIARGMDKKSPTYAGPQRGRLSQRNSRYPHRAEIGQFSLITCLYERSPAAAFEEAADSVLQQTSSHFQWIILAQGPIGSDLNAHLNRISNDPRITLMRHPINSGIIPGMRQCMEKASGQYIVPLDGDDLLTPDALSIVASRLREKKAALLYSDEDHLVAGKYKYPILRPDWDPILNLSCSYIFHLMAFDRRIGLELGVFSDSAVNWCQDWDTVTRFVGGGHTPVHIPEVLYHWRAHEASQTNKADPHEGSLRSQRHLLERFLSTRSDGYLFDIKPFPIFRGAQEWWLARRQIEPVSFDLAVTPNPLSSRVAVHDGGSFTFLSASTLSSIESLADMAANSTSSLIAVIRGDLTPSGDEWPWEAQGLFALHGDMSLLAGRILDSGRNVLGGPEQINAEGKSSCPYRGIAWNTPGEMALALKPHTVSCPNSAFFIVRTEFLRASLSKLPREATLEFIGPWLAMLAHREGRRVGYSPLIAVEAQAKFDCLMNPSDQERLAYLAFRNK
jgi:glycosyltransferase involved in cell wall biosynthesis